jgi:hypothetical protein
MTGVYGRIDSGDDQNLGVGSGVIRYTGSLNMLNSPEAQHIRLAARVTEKYRSSARSELTQIKRHLGGGRRKSTIDTLLIADDELREQAGSGDKDALAV